MSYARFGWDGSDVYVYEHVSGFIECCGCNLVEPEDPDFMYGSAQLKTARLALEHLEEHVSAGQTVPADTFERIKADHPDLDAEIPPYEREYEFKRVIITTETGSTYKILHNICHKQDKDGNHLDSFKVFYITGISADTQSMDDIFDKIKDGTFERRLPEVGERMYISGRDGWWLSTTVISVER